ncbi:MAG: hypothetical protein Fur0025_15050 [Oscillatoriaceae cyanobacterium]
MNQEESNSINLEELRHYDNRPGFDLVSCREVGLPVYKLTVQALTQVRKPISPIEEFVLKAIDAGLSDEVDIAGFLGLEQPIVTEAMVNLRMSEDIDLIAPEDSQMQVWKLTKKGETTLTGAENIVPEERTFDINFDGLLRYARWYGGLESALLREQDLKNRGMLEIPPLPKKRPQLTDINLKDVDHIIRKIDRKRKVKPERNSDLLALKGIEKMRTFFQPALALVYKAKDGDDVQVAFAIDERLSEEHEKAFAGGDGVRKMRILENLRKTEPLQLATDILGPEFVDTARDKLKPLESIEKQVATAKNQIAEIETTQNQSKETASDAEKLALEEQLQNKQREIEELEAKLADVQANVPMRWLEMYDHRPLLYRALQDSQKRLMIISPWIRANVVNRDFLKQLEKMLKQDVQVFIGYGLGEDKDENKSKWDREAEEKLQRLAQKYQQNFWLERLGDTHAKILISDSQFAVTTSFNWLSFKGSPDRTFRDERGTLVSDSQKIDELFDSYKQRFQG